MKKLAVLIGLTALITGSAMSAAVMAAEPTNTSGQALEIAPPVVNLTLNPGQSVTTQINLRGVSSERLLVTGEVNDFEAAGEDGTPKILLEEAEPSPYSIRDWVSPLPQLVLEPRQIRDMPVTIRVPHDAAPGGYFGVIRFSAVPPELEGTGVSLSASLGSLVLIRVNGEAKESMEIAEFSANKDGKSGSLFESTPIQFIERIKNTGNVHEQPAGQVTITDMFGKKVATLNVNLPPRNVLPNSTRKFDQMLDSSVLGNKKLFGRYKAELKIVYGANKETITTATSFWVIPYRLIGGAIVGLIITFFALKFMIRRYNQNIINKAQGKQTKRRK